MDNALVSYYASADVAKRRKTRRACVVGWVVFAFTYGPIITVGLVFWLAWRAGWYVLDRVLP